MAAWLNRTPQHFYKGPIPQGISGSAGAPAYFPGFNSVTKPKLLVVGENIIGPCIIDWLLIQWDNGASYGDVIDGINGDTAKKILNTTNVMTQFDDSFLFHMGGTLFRKGLYWYYDGSLHTSSVGYR